MLKYSKFLWNLFHNIWIRGCFINNISLIIFYSFGWNKDFHVQIWVSGLERIVSLFPQVIKYTWNRTIMRKKKQQAVADPRGRQGRNTPLSSKFFSFQFSAKIVQYNRLAQPSLDLAPPLGNPGSATYRPNLIWTHTHSLTTHTHTEAITQSQNLITLKCFASDCNVCTGIADKFYDFMKSYLFECTQKPQSVQYKNELHRSRVGLA